MTPKQFIKKTLLEMEEGYWLLRYGFMIARVGKNRFWFFGIEKDFNLIQAITFIRGESPI